MRSLPQAHCSCVLLLLPGAQHNQGVGACAGDQLFTRHYFDTVIHGGSNAEITAHLFPAWSLVEQTAFSDRKEAYFRELASKGAAPSVPLKRGSQLQLPDQRVARLRASPQMLECRRATAMLMCHACMCVMTVRPVRMPSAGNG